MTSMNDYFTESFKEHVAQLETIRRELLAWLDGLRRDVVDPVSFFNFIFGENGTPLFNSPDRLQDLSAYQVLGLERTASDSEIKTRYRQLLRLLHPDTAGGAGTGFLLRVVIAAYHVIAKERGWIA